MSRTEWLKRLQEMQAELDEHGISMWVHTDEGYLSVLVFDGNDPAADVMIIDALKEETNDRSWQEFEEKCKRLLPWWEVE